MMKSVIQGREVIVEFRPVGNVVRVAAIDAQSLTEISISGPVGTSEETLKRNAVKRLEYVLRKKGVIA